jgi:hypothetical protein
MTLLYYCWAYIWEVWINKWERSLHTQVYHSTFHYAYAMESAYMLNTDEWIKKMWCIYTMEYHSAIKKNECDFCGITLCF